MTAQADRAAVVVDAAAYFSAVKNASLQARHSVFLIGWDFDTRIELEPEDPAPNTLGAFLSYVVRRRPDLQMYVLRWDLASFKIPFAGARRGISTATRAAYAPMASRTGPGTMPR